jgi:hypothetical protein
MDDFSHTCFNFYSHYDALTLDVTVDSNSKKCAVPLYDNDLLNWNWSSHINRDIIDIEKIELPRVGGKILV